MRTPVLVAITACFLAPLAWRVDPSQWREGVDKLVTFTTLLTSDAPRAALFEHVWNTDGFAQDSSTTWFASDASPRSSRPKSVTFHVGQLYVHQQTGARGVIVGWDERTKAPRTWPSMSAALPERLYQPHYSVLEELVDAEGGPPLHMTRYIVSDNIRAARPPLRPMQHPDLEHYFEGFDPQKGYLLNAELRRRYPLG